MTYLNKLFNEVIDEVGVDCTVQIITDNDANMKKAGMMIIKQRPKIFWSPCAAHCSDSMVEEIVTRKMISRTKALEKPISFQ